MIVFITITANWVIIIKTSVIYSSTTYHNHLVVVNLTLSIEGRLEDNYLYKFQHFLVILKRIVQNYWKILKKWFHDTIWRVMSADLDVQIHIGVLSVKVISSDLSSVDLGSINFFCSNNCEKIRIYTRHCNSSIFKTSLEIKKIKYNILQFE